MVTVWRAEELRIVMFVEDHLPAHVQVLGDGQATINLERAGRDIELVWADGMTNGEVRRAMRVVRSQRARLLRRWRELHG
jgi:hypothetical protein